MNKPNEQILNQWLSGELEGEELLQIEEWAETHAGDLDEEFKCDIGWEALGANHMSALASSEEPPYPEFFNHKLEQAIQASETESVEGNIAQDKVVEMSSPSPAKSALWSKISQMVIPAAAAAAIAFYAGSQINSGENAGSLVAGEGVYVPDAAVVAAVSTSDNATEIVLEGLEPISDDVDIVRGETSQPSSDTMMVSVPGALDLGDVVINDELDRMY